MATERRATLILELKDYASKNLKGFVDIWAAGKTAIAAFNQTFGRAIEFLKDSLNSFAESEKAVSALNNALKNQGTFTEAYSQALQENAKALSRMSGKSDEVILETQTLLTTFGLAGKELNQTTKAALDLAAGLGVDLRTATLLLGKAWAGETATLGRYGLKVDETLPPMERFAALQEQISNRFGGRAQAETETYAGKVALLAESWDELKEAIGRDFAKSSEEAIVALTKLSRALEENYNIVRFILNPIDGMKERLAAIAPSLAGWAGSIGLISKEHATLFEIMAKVNEASKTKLGPDGKDPKSTNPAIQAEIDAEVRKQEELAELESFGLAETSRKKLESLTLTNAQLEQMEMERLARGLEQTDQAEAAKTLRESFYAKQRKDATIGTLNALATFQNAKTKELAAIGKAAALAAAYINTAQAVTVALKSAPPPFNFALAAAVGAAGAGQIATIAGVQLAEGGMVMSRSGGVRATMAEAGRDEVAIPLDDPRTKERLADTFDQGGGGIHFHIGTLIADEGGLMDLGRKMDEVFFKLGRRSMRVS